MRSKWTKLELNSSLRNELSKANCLSHCTALPVTCDSQRKFRVKIRSFYFSTGILLRVKDHRNILHEIRKWKANWIGHFCVETAFYNGLLKER